ncbi:DUF3389 domain-containing protein [Vibrio scophthalmi]|uniref:Phosphotransferase system IIA component n=2 Tax=Vibrio scophthalmi TaxID=45658 RepID=F9RP01_9VIBR|nr:DUF3389 domain-containing protein [Vibrio scophthalmi]ANU38402.1 hypothetical protein VSVS05_03364 [Vibrio scophthalmi]EGU36405.1 hypothetical protein VIS19158_12176 [Vibrio scophthalmi LMG 19158]
MVIEFSNGKIIATPHELVVKVNGAHMITLQAQSDAVQLIGRGANVIAVHSSEAKWSIKLDDEQQLIDLASQLGIAIQ